MKALRQLAARSFVIPLLAAALLSSAMSVIAAPSGEEDPIAPFGEDPGCLRLYRDAWFDPAQGTSQAKLILDDCRARVAAGGPAIVPKSGGGIITPSDFSSLEATANIYSDTLSPQGVNEMRGCMIGLVMGFYWHHRRVWVRVTDGSLYVGGHTNKNWYSFYRELSALDVLKDYDLKPAKK